MAAPDIDARFSPAKGLREFKLIHVKIGSHGSALNGCQHLCIGSRPLFGFCDFPVKGQQSVAVGRDHAHAFAVLFREFNIGQKFRISAHFNTALPGSFRCDGKRQNDELETITKELPGQTDPRDLPSGVGNQNGHRELIVRSNIGIPVFEG